MPIDCLCLGPPSIILHGGNEDLFFTSQPYPVHVLEQLTCSAALTGMFMWMPPSDDIVATCALTAGALTATVSYGGYYNYGAIPSDTSEHLISSVALTAGALTVTVMYSSYLNYGAISGDTGEHLASSAALTGGALTVTAGYVSYLNYGTTDTGEYLQASCALVSGSLT